MFLCGSSWQQLWKTQTKDILKELKTYFLQCHVCTTHKNNNNYCLFAWINQEKISSWYSTNWSRQCNHESLHFGSCDIQPSSCVSWKLGHCMFGSQISILGTVCVFGLPLCESLPLYSCNWSKPYSPTALPLLDPETYYL